MGNRVKLISLACKTRDLQACIAEQQEAQRQRVHQELDYLLGRYRVTEPPRG